MSSAIRVMTDNTQVADNGPKQCRTEEARNISSNGGDRESTHKLLFRDARPYSFIYRYRRFGRIHCHCTQDRRVHRAGKVEETVAMSEILMATIGNLTAICSKLFPVSASSSASVSLLRYSYGFYRTVSTCLPDHSAADSSKS